ncbi:MAG: helix-turn-helix domain-containing protein [Firmicutes bacterium]|nr:helix-turn-helix domain-containing protein [Bacillota bacterium]
MMTFQEWKKEQLKDPIVRLEYEKIQLEKMLAKKLAETRIQQNITQQELADKVGVKQSHLSRFENGKHAPSLEFIQRVASGLGKQLHIEFR